MKPKYILGYIDNIGFRSYAILAYVKDIDTYQTFAFGKLDDLRIILDDLEKVGAYGD